MQWILPGLMIVVDHGYNPQIAWSIPTVTVAIDPRDAICYMEMADGRIIDLSRVCGGRETRLVSLSPVDQQFLDNYQDALRRQYNQLPAAQTALTQVQQNPQSVLQRAQQVCTSVRNGMSPELALLGEGQVDSALINDLALNHYCPDVND